MDIKLGDHVLYEDKEYIIARNYGNGMFTIGNDKHFIDFVDEEELVKVSSKLRTLNDPWVY